MLYTSLRALREDLKIKRSAYLFAGGRTFYARRFGNEKTAAEFIAIRPSTYQPMEEDPGADIFVQRMPDISNPVLYRAAAVCLDTFNRLQSEMVMLLRLSDGLLRVEAPKFSVVSPAEVSYYTDRPISGTIHYHPGKIGAEPSTTDDRDEMWTPGIHIILSNVNGEGLADDGLTADVFLTGNGVRKRIHESSRVLSKPIIDKVTKESEQYIEEVRKKIMHLDDFLSKKIGYYLADGSEAVFWFKTREEAEENKGKLDIIPVRQLRIAGISPEEARKVAEEIVEEMAKSPAGKPMLRYIKEALDKMLGG